MANEGQSWWRRRTADALGLVTDRLVQVNSQPGVGIFARLQGDDPNQRLIRLIDNSTGACALPAFEITGTNNARTGPALRIGMLGAALTQNVFEIAAGDNALVSLPNEGRLRYSQGALAFQVSMNTGPWTSIITAATLTLQGAYDGGQEIVTSDAQGDIIFSKGGTTVADQVLLVQDQTGLACTGALVELYNENDLRVTGTLLLIDQSGATFDGDVVRVVLNASDVNAQALVVDDESAAISTNPLVQIQNSGGTGRTTGPLLEIDQNGGNFSGDALRVDVSNGAAGASGLVIDDTSATATTGPLMEIQNSVGSGRTTGAMFELDQNAAAFQGSALLINLANTSTTQQAIQITEAGSANNTNPLVQVINTNNGRIGNSGALVQIQDDATGAADGALLNLQGTNNARTGPAIQIAQSGAANLGNYIRIGAGQGCANSPANYGHLRYNSTRQSFQVSRNTVNYEDVVVEVQATGTNDHLIINAAIAEVAALGGGTVRLGGGTFVLGAAVTMASNVFLQGAGAATDLEINYAGPAIRADTLDRFKIAYLQLSQNDGGSTYGIHVTDCYYFEIFGNHVNCLLSDGIRLDNTYGNRSVFFCIYGNYIRTSGGAGIHLLSGFAAGSVGRGTITGNVLYYCQGTACIYITATGCVMEVTIAGNTMFCGAAATDAVHYVRTGGWLSSVTITGNFAMSSVTGTGAGYYIDMGNLANSVVTVTGNSALGWSGVGGSGFETLNVGVGQNTVSSNAATSNTADYTLAGNTVAAGNA